MKKDLTIAIPKDYSECSTGTNPLFKLSFGKQKIIISKEELNKLETIYKQYVDVFGVDIGFYRKLSDRES